MDGREFVNMPPLGLSGLPLEPGRVSSGAAGGRLIPSTGQLPPFCTAKYFPTPLGLHSQPGFPHLGRTMYHSYIPLSHLESSTGGSPLLTHMGPRNLIEPPKDGFCFSAPLSTYHPRPSMGKTSTNQTQSSRLNENEGLCHSYKNAREASKDSKEKFCRNEPLCNSQLMGTSKKDGRLSEETFSGEMTDYDSETKMEKERKKSGLPRVPKIGDHVSSFISEQALIHWSGSSEKSTHAHAHHTSLLSNCNHGNDSFVKSLVSEDDRCVKDTSRHEENVRTMLPASIHRAKRSDSTGTPATTLNVLCNCSKLHPSNLLCKIGSSSPVPAQPLHTSTYNIKQQSKDNDKTKTIVAPTCEPHFEVLKEQNDSTQVGNQIHDFKGKDVGRLDEKAEVSYSNFPQDVSNNEHKRVEVFREKGSVICCNSFIKSQGVSDSFTDTPVNTLEKRTSVSTKDAGLAHCRQSDHSKEKCKISGFLDSHQHTGHSLANLSEQKVKHLEISDFRPSQMDGLSAQHFTTSHGKEEAKKLGSETKTSGSNKAHSDFTYPFIHSEGCAMQSLIKYSGNFEKEAAFWKSGDKKSPFGGLGSMRLEESQAKAAKGQSVSHQDVKRETDRPGSTKSFAKDTMGFQGEVEVRNPPVGIAVAVARQKDNNGNKSVSSKGHTNEENGDEQIRNCNERVLIERMDREHAALLRENKDLPDISPMHPAGCPAIGLSSNLMVTGGPALSGPWTSDSTSHLTTHPWLSSGVLPCMWHADNPYGLAHPTLHQGMNPAVPPGVPASFPSAYSFARDPQNGQIVVIPADHISNFEILDRTSSLWPSMYSSAHSSLQHAHHLQLFSQQQLMRQHELYMLLQQQAVHSIDLHRSAQLEALESQRSEQVDTIDLHRNSQLDILEMQRSARMEMKELHRRNHVESQQYHRNEHCMEPAKVSEERAVQYTPESRHPSPLCSSGSVQKKEISQASSTSCVKEFDLSPIPLKVFPLSNKSEEMTHQRHDIHTSKNSDLCPAVSASILPTKVEDNEELAKDINIKEDSSPNEDTTQGFPFQSLSGSVRHLSYISQSHKISDEESFVPIVKQPELSTECSEVHLNSRSQITKDFETSEEIDNTIKVEDVSTVTCRQSLQEESGSCSEPVECQKGFAQDIKAMDMEEIDHISAVENITSCTSEINLSTGKETCSTQTDFTDTLSHDANCKINMIVMPQGGLPPHSINEMMDHSVEISKVYMEGDIEEMYSSEGENVSGGFTDIKSTDLKTEDPLAGMNVLVAATEMPEANSLLPMSTVILTPDMTLDHTLLQGIVLLSEMAELELEKRKQVDSLQSYHMRPSLESLLAASAQMLMEVLSSPALDGLKPESIKLPRELSHNKKYSWKQEKNNPHFSLTSAIEVMDSVEMDCRVRLADLQRRYKVKQKELAKLQRKRDSEDKTDERSKTMLRRGPGRPKKRKHGTSPLFHKEERIKNSNNRRLEKGALLSGSCKTGGFFRRSMLNVSEVDEMENEIEDMKGRLHCQEEHDRVPDYIYEAQSIFKKKRKSSIQDHLIDTLDTALSLTKQNEDKSCFRFTDHNGRKQRDARNYKNISPSDFKQMCSIQLSRTMSKEDTDTDEDENDSRSEWSSQSRPLQYSMCSMLSRKMKSFESSPSPERIPSCYRTGKHKSVSRNKQFRLLLMDREAGLSFSDSTEDSFDQGY